MKMLQNAGKRKINLLAPGVFVWVLFISIFIFAIFAGWPIFLRPRNISNVFMIQSVGLGIATMAQSLIIISGGIDMSMGAVVSALTVIAAGLFKSFESINPFVVFLVLIAAGTLIGLFNGLLVVRLKLPPFMATLASSLIVQGLIYLYTKKPIGGIPLSFRFIADGKIIGIQFCMLYMILIIAVVWFILNKHRAGKHLYAVGTNEYVARISGINVERVKLMTYTFAGTLVGLSTVFLSARMGGGGPLTGQGYELNTITASVIGGISLAGGQGGVIGALGGVLILSLFNNLMNLMDISPYIQMLLKGVILLLAVSFYSKKKEG